MDARETTAPLRIETLSHQAVATVWVAGEIDISNVAQFERSLADAVNSGVPAVEVDLREVAFFDCSAMRALLNVHRFLSRRGRTLTVHARPSGERLFALARLDRVLAIQPDGAPLAV